MILWLIACSVAESPSCVTDELHACSDIEIAHSCNTLFAFDGLHVDFVGGTLDSYTALVELDGVPTAFTWDGTETTTTDGTVWMADEGGFFVSGNGDTAVVTVTSGDASFNQSFEPCWDASEPNGRCCGWNFQATVELDLG